ncbi:MAG: SMC-Scp complex subunit ScpB [Acidobacteriota bacterium]
MEEAGEKESDSPAPAAEAPRPRESSVRKIRPALEALLFSSARPIREVELAEVLEATSEAVAAALASLAEEADAPTRGVRLESVAGGWRYVTRPEFDSLLRKFHEVTERSRLSLAALETLAIIAYRQPITMPEIQEIRGVNSSSVLTTLLEKKLVTTAGRKPVVGTPFLYRTTRDFLVRFGLNELDDLPKPEELDADLAATVEPDEVAGPAATEAPPPPEEPESEGDEEDNDRQDDEYDEDLEDLKDDADD